MNRTFFKKVIKKLRGGVVTLYPQSKVKGRVLVSYKTEPFFDFEEKEHIHTNIWECREIVNAFLELGYVVDVIDWFNPTFTPKHKYKYFLDLGLNNNMGRISSLLNMDCLKIFYSTTSHWLFNNQAEYERLSYLKERKGVVLKPRRIILPSQNIQLANFSTILGNKTTQSTYSFADKKMYPIPLSTTHTYPFPKNKDIEKAKKSFVWIGGAGMVHKGLDLVLETFANLPDHKLYVCGAVSNEKDFETLYYHELYNTSNIKSLGKIDLGGEVFREIVNSSIALIYPSCSEGQSGAVVTAMHAGLIPVISSRSGVNTEDFGIVIKDSTLEEVGKNVLKISNMPNTELSQRSKKAWEYARAHHTRERFKEEFNKFVNILESTDSSSNL